MCVSCVSNTELMAANAGLAFAVGRPLLHRFAPGLLPPPDPIVAHQRAVGFLRQLELDPVEILGEAVVAAADGAPVRRSEPAASLRRYLTERGRSMRSQPQLAVQ